jgi:hypothetical protein
MKSFDRDSLANPEATRQYIRDDDPLDPELVSFLLGFKPPTNSGKRCASSRILVVFVTGRYILCSPSCKSWKCNLCRPHLRWKWGEHFVRLFINQRSRCFVATVESSEWSSTRRSILKPRKNAKTGRYLRVGDLVISTAPVGFGGKETVDCVESLRLIGSALKAVEPRPGIGQRCQPVSTSRCWSLPKPERSGSVGVATISARVSLDTILSAMDSLGIGYSLRRKKSSWSIVLAEETGKDRVDALSESLRRV